MQLQLQPAHQDYYLSYGKPAHVAMAFCFGVDAGIDRIRFLGVLGLFGTHIENRVQALGCIKKRIERSFAL